LVFFHLGEGTLCALDPGASGIGDVGLLHAGNALVGTAKLGQAHAKLRVRLEVVTVCDQDIGKVADGKVLLFALALVTAGQGLYVAGRGLLETLHAWELVSTMARKDGVQINLTLLSQGHLDLEHLEVLRGVGLDLAAHALATPLLEAVELLIDVHG